MLSSFSMKSSLIILFVFILTLATGEARVVSCSHRELCLMLEQIALENQLTDIQTETLVNMVGDPHEFDPSTTELKKLMNAPFLITGPQELNPWIKRILHQRSKHIEKKTISLLFSSSHLAFYPKSNAETLSHFWLYPKVYCALKKSLEEQFTNWGYFIKKQNLCPSKQIEDDLRNSLQKISHPIILTHDALLPLLEGLMNSNTQKIVALKGSSHHEETSPQAIKKMVDTLKAPKVIWVIETGINVPPNILKKIRSQDLIIKLDTANSFGTQPFSILHELSLALNSLAEKRP